MPKRSCNEKTKNAHRVKLLKLLLKEFVDFEKYKLRSRDDGSISLTPIRSKGINDIGNHNDIAEHFEGNGSYKSKMIGEWIGNMFWCDEIRFIESFNFGKYDRFDKEDYR